jgi:hypothetical protein
MQCDAGGDQENLAAVLRLSATVYTSRYIMAVALGDPTSEYSNYM